MPPVTHNMILGMRAYHVVNRGIDLPTCGAGIHVLYYLYLLLLYL